MKLSNFNAKYGKGSKVSNRLSFNPFTLTNDEAKKYLEKVSREDLIKALQSQDKDGSYDDISQTTDNGKPATKPELVKYFWINWTEANGKKYGKGGNSGDRHKYYIKAYRTENDKKEKRAFKRWLLYLLFAPRSEISTSP